MQHKEKISSKSNPNITLKAEEGYKKKRGLDKERERHVSLTNNRFLTQVGVDVEAESVPRAPA